MEATVNGLKVGIWTFVERAGHLFVGKDALEEWRVQLAPAARPVSVRGVDYWPLDSVPGYQAKLSVATQSIDLTFSPDAFFATKLTRELELPKPSPVLPSVFVNYDLTLDSSRVRDQPVRTGFGALLELGASTPWGVLTSTHVGRSLNDSTAFDSGWARLETTFTRQFPERAITFRLGDSSTRQGLWGSSVYFGGVQISRNFGLQPGFLTQPVPVVSGVSAAPSTVQLYVNDVLRKVSEVPAGPFVIDNLAGITGAGEARLVMRDVLGREVVVTQRYFTSAQLLAAGLSDWSVEAGRLRTDLGSKNSSYSDRFVTGTWRHGWNDDFTFEGRAEAWMEGRTAGAGFVHALPSDWLARGAWSVSDYTGLGIGHKAAVGVERQWSNASLFLQLQSSSRTYRQLGLTATGSGFPRSEWTANVTMPAGGAARLGITLTGLRNYDAGPVTTMALNYTVPLPRRMTLVLSANRAIGNGSGTFVGASLSIPLDTSLTAQAAVSHHRGGTDAYASVNRSSTPELDFGWRALAGRIQNEAHSEIGVYYGGQYGRVYADLSATPSQQSLRSGVSGGLIWADGRYFATKRMDQSFALVQLKGYPDVGVGLGSNELTRTDASGVALLPTLSPYQANQVRLTAGDVPITVELESLEQIVVPSWRSGVLVDFPVKTGRAALLRIVFADGEPAPAGAVVRVDGDKEDYYVARRGEAYVTGLQEQSVVKLRWNDQECAIRVAIPPGDRQEVVRMGPLRCEGVAR